MRRIVLAAAVVLLAASGTTTAQETIRLSSIEGNVDISSGGEFVDARDGQAVFPGQQLLIGPDSSATVSYPDDCNVRYLLPGQFPILPECDLRRSPERSQEQQVQATASDALTTTAVVGGAVLGVAAIIEESLDDDDSEDAPVSP